MRLLSWLALWVCGTSPVLAATAADAPAGYVLPESETWEIKSAAGDPYRIFVSHPKGQPPTDGYPVLYVLDGNTIFASFAEARRLQQLADKNIATSLIVAIGYPTDEPYALERRMNDFTGPFPDPIPAAQKRFASWKAGGNDRFMSFILDVLRPAVASRYPVNPQRQALFGHSLGGLFALHMLYQHPDAFLAIIAASPSIFWNNQAILAEERQFAARLSQSKTPAPIARLLLVVGEREETAVENWDAEPLAGRLQALSAYGLRTRYEVFQDEGHLGVPTRAITGTLRFAFAWP